MIGALRSRAASSAATAVDDEVTFCNGQQEEREKSQQGGPGRRRRSTAWRARSGEGHAGRGIAPTTNTTYHGGDGEAFDLSVLKEPEHVVAGDDTALARQMGSSHCVRDGEMGQEEKRTKTDLES